LRRGEPAQKPNTSVPLADVHHRAHGAREQKSGDAVAIPFAGRAFPLR
jgi:hypothetical protein